MSLVFYRAPMSTATITDLVLAELDVPHERVTFDLKKKDHKAAEHLARDPNGRVPVIVHDGVSIFESAAITIYLGETFGAAKKLWPTGAKRGEAMKWVVWTNVTLGESTYRWARNTMWAPDEEKNAKAAEAAMKDMQHGLSLLDKSLEGRAFLAGDYSLADTHVASFVDWLRHMKVDMKSFPHLAEWSKRCSERPAYRKVMSSEG